MRAYQRAVAALVLTTFALSSGCATIFTGSSDNVSVMSEPTGGKVYINGNFMGNTPVNLNLKRDKDYNIMVKKDGYEPANATLTRSFNAVAILNLAGLLCWVVDIVTGAMWKFDQNAITVTLEKTGAKSSSSSSVNGRIVAGQDMIATPYNGKTALIFNAKPAH